jgi:hypothetical protein
MDSVVDNMISLSNTFKISIIDFIDEMIAQFQEETDLILLRVYFDTHLSDIELMEHFVTYVYPHKKLILEKNDAFFLDEKNEIFGPIEQTKVSHFKNLWLSKKTDKHTKETIWMWFRSFIHATEQYLALKNKRK